MLLHIGQGRTVPLESVIAMMDLTPSPSPGARQVMEALKARGHLHALSADPHSLILLSGTGDRAELTGYLTPVGMRTLRTRASLSPEDLIQKG